MSTRESTAKSATDKTEEVANTVKKVSQETTAKVENFVNDSQQSMNAQFEKMTKGFEGISALGQENLDALVKSSEIAARAAEGIGSEMSAFSKKSFEDGIAAAQDLASAKSVTELFEKQTSFAQSAFEGWMHQATKMGEICSAAAKDISAPMSASLNSATDRMKSLSY